MLFSRQNRLRKHTLAIVLPTGTKWHSWAFDNSMQHEPLLATPLWLLRCLQAFCQPVRNCLQNYVLWLCPSLDCLTAVTRSMESSGVTTKLLSCATTEAACLFMSSWPVASSAISVARLLTVDTCWIKASMMLSIRGCTGSYINASFLCHEAGAWNMVASKHQEQACEYMAASEHAKNLNMHSFKCCSFLSWCSKLWFRVQGLGFYGLDCQVLISSSTITEPGQQWKSEESYCTCKSINAITYNLITLRGKASQP